MISEPKAYEITVTREHREAAWKTLWPGITPASIEERMWLNGEPHGPHAVPFKVNRLALALAEAEHRGRVSAEPRWISCSERTPDDCALVLIRKPDWGGYCETATWGEENKHWVASEYGPYEAAEVSHWMPLPNPPEDPQPTKETP